MGFFEDLANAAAAVVSTVGDAAEGVVETVTETAENVVDAVCDTTQDGINAVTGWVAANGGPVAGSVVNVVGGILVGTIEMVQDVSKDYLHILRDEGAIIGAFLRFDFPRLSEEILNLLIDVADLGVDLVRAWAGGYFVSAILDNFQREDLRAFVERLLRTELAGDPRLDEILERLNIRSGAWGLAFPAHSHVMMFDTRTPGVADTLRQMHEEKKLDLYALSNLLSFDSFTVFRPRTYVRVLSSKGDRELLPVNRYHIAKFLEGESIHLQIFALSPEALDDCLKVARTKFKKMGIHLRWNDDFWVPTFGEMTPHEITRPEEYRLDILSHVTQGVYFQNSGLKDPQEGECPVRCLAGFHYVPNPRAADPNNAEIFGQVCGRDVEIGPVRPGRTDRCPNTVNRGTVEGPLQGSGVIYRDIYLPYVSRYVLAHEIGHYFGLCHIGHDGLQNIMFSKAGGSNPLDPGLWQFYLHSEPEFTWEDGKNVWRFIVDQMRDCL